MINEIIIKLEASLLEKTFKRAKNHKEDRDTVNKMFISRIITSPIIKIVNWVVKQKRFELKLYTISHSNGNIRKDSQRHYLLEYAK